MGRLCGIALGERRSRGGARGEHRQTHTCFKSQSSSPIRLQKLYKYFAYTRHSFSPPPSASLSRPLPLPLFRSLTPPILSSPSSSISITASPSQLTRRPLFSSWPSRTRRPGRASSSSCASVHSRLGIVIQVLRLRGEAGVRGRVAEGEGGGEGVGMGGRGEGEEGGGVCRGIRGDWCVGGMACVVCNKGWWVEEWGSRVLLEGWIFAVIIWWEWEQWG